MKTCPKKKNEICTLEEIFSCRWDTILELENSIIDKGAFIVKNAECIKFNGVKAFLNPRNLEEGFYNYFYYNTLAKINLYEISILEERFQKESIINSFMQEVHEMYKKKDLATSYILNTLNYKGIESYPLKLESEKLRENLFEIVLHSYPEMILHTKSHKIRKELILRKCYQSTVRTSKIDSYVNSKCQEITKTSEIQEL